MGETGTLQDEALGTIAQDDCRGKTGTLHDVANLAGYCQASDGHTLAFAFLANGLGDPDYVHRSRRHDRRAREVQRLSRSASARLTPPPQRAGRRALRQQRAEPRLVEHRHAELLGLREL